MGKNNKARRAAKRRKRQQRSQQPGGHGRAGHRPYEHRGHHRGNEHHDHRHRPEPPPVDLGSLLGAAVAHYRDGEPRRAEGAVATLAAAPVRDVADICSTMILDLVDGVLQDGWQPRELCRQVHKRDSATTAQFAKLAVGAYHARFDDDTVDPRWRQQLDDLEVPPVHRDDLPAGRWLLRSIATGAFDQRTMVEGVVAVMGICVELPSIETLIPPPGTGSSAPIEAPRANVDENTRRVLDKVRHLLAKAEATDFEAEAITFTSKAHELIAKHAIDTALLDADPASDGDPEHPDTVRIPVDDPYYDAKSVLLSVVATANRCRSVGLTGTGLVSVVGFRNDLAATELMFTSLLVQAQAAMTAVGRTAPPGSRPRSAAFRASFLVAYASRIAERLDDINAHVAAQSAADGVEVLPALRSRADTVADEFERRYPNVASSRIRGARDGAGFASGRSAADLAKLQAADLTAPYCRGATRSQSRVCTPWDAVGFGA